ncbi:MAG: hypothetical protein HS115_12150 [Spirochaetales bacterium]|nr:hypothetical protein [Spirochaetales bacterium]
MHQLGVALVEPSDASYLLQVTGSLRELQTRYPDNIALIQTHAQIDELFRRGLLVDERQVPQAQGTRRRGTSVGQDTPRITIPREPDLEPVNIQVLSDEPHVEQENEDRLDAPGLLILRSQLVYEKLELSRSDAQIVPEGSNPTGNVRLSGANFTINGWTDPPKLEINFLNSAKIFPDIQLATSRREQNVA